MELLKSRTGSAITHVPYRGSAPALQDVIGGQIPVMFDSIAASGPQIRAGKVKALGIAGLARSEALPGVPTISESAAGLGLKDFDTPGWIALYAPKGLPIAVITRLQDAVAKVLESPDTAQRFAAAGACHVTWARRHWAPTRLPRSSSGARPSASRAPGSTEAILEPRSRPHRRQIPHHPGPHGLDCAHPIGLGSLAPAAWG